MKLRLPSKISLSDKKSRFGAVGRSFGGLECGARALQEILREMSRLDLRKLKIETWDAGFYQIRMALGDSEILREPMRALGAKLEPQIYELGFLRDEVRYFAED